MSNEILGSTINKQLFKNYNIKNGVWSTATEQDQGYASNFGLQWELFHNTQLDSFTGLNTSENRLFGCSGWHPESLSGKKVLEIGSGAGRFTEILLKHGAHVVSTDLSNAIYVNQKNNHSERLLLIKEDLSQLPIQPSCFDFVLCYGVIQHTPQPEESYKKIVSYANENGVCAFDHYSTSKLPSPWNFPKYAWRPITTKVEPKKLLKIIETYIPKYFPVDTFIKSIPKVGGYIAGCIPIPCWNYSGIPDFPQDDEALVRWAIMDTFDALGAKYDTPWSLKRLQKFAGSLPVKSYHTGIGGNGILLNTYGNTQSTTYS